MFRFLSNSRYFKLYFDINGKNLTDLSKKHGTVSHLSTVTDQWVREGLITKIIDGREVIIKLTKEGEDFKVILRTFDNFARNQLQKVNTIGGKNDKI